MIKQDSRVKRGHGYPRLCKRGDRATGEGREQMKARGGWEDLGMFRVFFQGEFMAQLINDYAS